MQLYHTEYMSLQGGPFHKCHHLISLGLEFLSYDLGIWKSEGFYPKSQDKAPIVYINTFGDCE